MQNENWSISLSSDIFLLIPIKRSVVFLMMLLLLWVYVIGEAGFFKFWSLEDYLYDYVNENLRFFLKHHCAHY